MKDYYTWLAERTLLQEDIIFHENAKLFDARSYLAQKLPGHECLTACIGPQEESR